MFSARKALIAIVLSAALALLTIFSLSTDPAGGENSPQKQALIERTDHDRMPTMTAHQLPTTARATIAPPLCDARCVAWDAAFRYRDWIRTVIHRTGFLVCIRAHESSHTEPWHDDGYGAHNSSSSASGAYQFLDGTWANVARRWFPWRVGQEARQAEWWEQDEGAYRLYLETGGSPWAGSGC